MTVLVYIEILLKNHVGIEAVVRKKYMQGGRTRQKQFGKFSVRP
jgi:hypothetical protein